MLVKIISCKGFVVSLIMISQVSVYLILCVKRSLSIHHDFFFSNFVCDTPRDTCAVFLDISTAYGKIRITDLIFKFKYFGISGDLLELIQNLLSNKFQRVVLNGKTSEWEKINTGVPQGSILRQLFFLIYINDLSDGTSSLVNQFADDTSLFSVVQNKNHSASQLCSNLDKVINWAYTWKKSFNLDRSKPAQDVIFSRKCTDEDHPPIHFNNIPDTQTTVQNHTGCILMKNSITILR